MNNFFLSKKYFYLFLIFCFVKCSNEKTTNKNENNRNNNNSIAANKVLIPNLTALFDTTNHNEGMSDIKAKAMALCCLKRFYEMHFDQRDKIKVPDIFISEEIKTAVVFRFLITHQTQRPTVYDTEYAEILDNETITLKDGTVVIAALEKAANIDFGHPFDTTISIKADVSKKYFFLFQKKGNKYLLANLQMLNFFNKPINTKYSF